MPSGHPQHLGIDSFDCCIERYEIVVYCPFNFCSHFAEEESWLLYILLDFGIPYHASVNPLFKNIRMHHECEGGIKKSVGSLIGIMRLTE